MKKTRIIIFAKAPVAGLAKTRMIPALGAHGAAQLARRLLLHTVEEAVKADVDTVELCVTPAGDAPIWQSLPLPASLVWSAQVEGDLGQRLAHAAQKAAEAGEQILLMGTDCPDLRGPLLTKAAAGLKHTDAVLIPSFDGGYALLGLRAFDPTLFENIAWSTSCVSATTRERLAKLGWSVTLMPTLHDMDEPEDLQWLPAQWLDPDL